MSVMMGLRISVDVERFMEVVASNPDRIKAISEQGKAAGAIHHAFYGSVNGDELLVVDEWPSKEAFLGFFGTNDQIGEMMQEAGATGEPQPAFWQELDTPDKF
jgi:hypothetical protein